MERIDERAKRLLEEIDDNTAELSSYRPEICLIGNRESPFIRVLEKRAIKVGVRSRLIENDNQCLDTLLPSKSVRSVVWDTEWSQGKEFFDKLKNGCYDIDCVGEVSLYAESAVSCAVSLLVANCIHKPGAHVLVVGRRHAVAGMYAFLNRHNYTPLMSHRYTRSVLQLSTVSDVVINTSRQPVQIAPRSGCIVFDVSGTANYLENQISEYIGVGEIGRLNTSILMNRAARCAQAARTSFPLVSEEEVFIHE